MLGALKRILLPSALPWRVNAFVLTAVHAIMALCCATSAGVATDRQGCGGPPAVWLSLGAVLSVANALYHIGFQIRIDRFARDRSNDACIAGSSAFALLMLHWFSAVGGIVLVLDVVWIATGARYEAATSVCKAHFNYLVSLGIAALVLYGALFVFTLATEMCSTPEWKFAAEVREGMRDQDRRGAARAMGGGFDRAVQNDPRYPKSRRQLEQMAEEQAAAAEAAEREQLERRMRPIRTGRHAHKDPGAAVAATAASATSSAGERGAFSDPESDGGGRASERPDGITLPGPESRRSGSRQAREGAAKTVRFTTPHAPPVATTNDSGDFLNDAGGGGSFSDMRLTGAGESAAREHTRPASSSSLFSSARGHRAVVAARQQLSQSQSQVQSPEIVASP